MRPLAIILIVIALLLLLNKFVFKKSLLDVADMFKKSNGIPTDKQIKTLKKINAMQIDNAKLIASELNKDGISNKNLVIGILSNNGKESNFIPQEEKSYRNTSAARIRSIFPTATKGLSDTQIDTLKKDDVKFFALVYGGKFGNDTDKDGFKFRGRGFNQLTFRANYTHYGKLIGIDLEAKPELLNDPRIAAMVCAAFFKEGLHNLANKIEKVYGITDVYNPSTIKEGTQIAVSINSGGKDKRGSETEAQALAFNSKLATLNIV